MPQPIFDIKDKVGIVQALHLLLARVHLAEAGVRPLAPDDEVLLSMVSDWWERNNPKNQVDALPTKPVYLCKCFEAECPHSHER